MNFRPLFSTFTFWLAIPMAAAIAQTSTPINSINCPGNGENLFVISQPGSYHLAANVAGERGKNGILIQADDVSLNGNGFAVRGGPGCRTAILTTSPRRGVRVTNATISEWETGAVTVLGQGASVSELKVFDCHGGGISLDDKAATRISKCEIRDLVLPAGSAAVRASLVESCAVSNVFADGAVTPIRGSTITGCDVTNVRSASSSAIGIDGEVIAGSRVEKIEGDPATSAGMRGNVVANSAATGMLDHASPAPLQPARAASAPAGEDPFPDGMTRQEFRALAGQVLSELRILSSVIDQWAIENNKRGTDRPEIKDLAPFVSKRLRLRAELDAGRCVDSIGNPIRFGTVDELPALSRKTAAHFALVANSDFWKPFLIAD